MKKKKSCSHRCPDSVYFHTLLLIIYFSAIERLICSREISLIGSTSFGFAQNTMHGFQNTVLNSYCHCLRQMPQKSLRQISYEFCPTFSRIILTSGQDETAEPHSSVGSVADLRTGRWFDPRLGQYSFRGLMIIIATRFIPLSPLSVVSTMVMWESSQWLGKNIVRSTGKESSRKAWIGALAAAI